MSEKANKYLNAINEMWERAGIHAAQHERSMIDTDRELLERQRRYFVNAFRLRRNKAGDPPRVSEPLKVIAEVAGYNDESGIYHFATKGGKDKTERAAIKILRGHWRVYKETGTLPAVPQPAES
jgi:hypothetical protein